MIAGLLRSQLRKQLWWIKFQELNREGWKDAWLRRRVQDAILATPPFDTDRQGELEVRALTWRRDWKNLIWALKSFYHFAGVTYPLHIHDGGLDAEGRSVLRAHFPNAWIPSKEETEARVEEVFRRRGLNRCLAYRKNNTMVFKLFDFFALTEARTVISIDSDIVFFARPDELLYGHPGKNVFNRDQSCYYTVSPEELEESFQIRPVPYINAGLSRVDSRSVDFDAIEQWMASPKLFTEEWVIEQTLHALCATRYGVELLAPSYMVSTKPGIVENVVCKHYPGNTRPLLYQEGMRRLADSHFLEEFTRTVGARAEACAR